MTKWIFIYLMLAETPLDLISKFSDQPKALSLFITLKTTKFNAHKTEVDKKKLEHTPVCKGEDTEII